eukprot:SAG25_NODE_7491_length_478_cov_0.773087_1_plen_50_part_10
MRTEATRSPDAFPAAVCDDQTRYSLYPEPHSLDRAQSLLTVCDDKARKVP